MQITTAGQTFDSEDVAILDYSLEPERVVLTLEGGREVVISGEGEVLRVLGLLRKREG